ncbi:hypothetical protein [Romboutsia ilealis]|nr:hypothetical protein [Romboutsia ilealis]
MKINKQCEGCKNKCKIKTVNSAKIFCNKYVKIVNEQLKFKI